MSKWLPIEDLPEHIETLSTGELQSLLEVWRDERGALEESGALGRFNERLHRRWAIETGVIEGVYTLDRGTTEVLIERGIHADLIAHSSTNRTPELVAQIIEDHRHALKGMFSFVKSERELSTGYVKELHATLLAHQDTTDLRDQFGNFIQVRVERGAYKLLPNNPSRSDGTTHEYCPPEHVASEMDRLIEMHRQHIARAVGPEIEAAWLHHRFTQIHPFTDGNGRVARALASLVLIRAGWFPLIVDRGEDRAHYIDALEAADEGNLSFLVNLIERKQRNEYLNALHAQEEVQPPSTPEEVLQRIMRSRRARPSPDRDYREAVYGIAAKLGERSAERMRDIMRAMSSAGLGGGGEIGTAQNPPNLADWANTRGYTINTEYSRVVQMHAMATVPFTVGIAFHAVGQHFHGVLAALAYTESADGLAPVGDIFQFNYREPFDRTLARFNPWLEKALTEAMLRWRERLAL